jgi:aminopeptidase N
VKVIFHVLFICALALTASAQYNLPEEPFGDYCHHQKSAHALQKTYYSPVSSNPLLDHYDVHFYFLDISAENNTVFISGNVMIGATVTAAVLDTFAFELSGAMVVDSVLFNGIPQEVEHSGDMGYVILEDPLSEGTDFSMKIYYNGLPPTGGFFSGISTVYDTLWNQHVTWTLSEPYAAKDWFPVKQDLNDKADSVWVFVTTSAENKVGSEGVLTHVNSIPGGKVRYEWKSRYPIAYYLISIAVANYQDYSLWAHPQNMDDSILVQNFIYDTPGCLSQWKGGIDQTAGFIELFSQLFGPYPFGKEKYGHCLAGIGGGMEHQTMTTLGGFNFGLVAHELGHMWFGDHVTCASWNDIWINEGFATYSDYLAHQFLAEPIYDSVWLKIRHDYVKSAPGGSVYVPDSLLGDIWRIFDSRLSYSKGALLLHMIRFELRDDPMFFYILTKFGEEYSFSNASAMDFKAVLEELSGKDFTTFFDQWYYGEGYPVFDINWWQIGDTLHIYSLETASTAATPFFRMIVPYRVIFTDGSDTSLLLHQDAPVNGFQIFSGKTVDSLEVDPEQWTLHKVNSLRMAIEEPENTVYFTIGPNPTDGIVRLFMKEGTFAGFTISVSDLAGRMMLEQEVTSSVMEIDLSGWQAGFYLVRVSNGMTNYTKRLVKL